MTPHLPVSEPSTPVAYDAVLLVSFGGPEGQEDVLPFLRKVTSGRGIPDERLEEVAHHYRAFGGISPINAQNRALQAALQAEIDSRGLDLPVLWGNRNWDPYLADALREAHSAGYRRLLAVVTSAYSSYSGCRQYREDLATALEETGLASELSIDKVRQYFDHPGFVGPFVEGVGAGLTSLAAGLGHDGDLARDAHVVFVTHSIPSATAAASGPPGAGLGEEGAYGAQHRAVAALVMERLAASHGVGHGVGWSLAFQSRSGSPATPWLEPDINDHLAALAAAGTTAVVIAPIGFVSDHMEVIWDLDEQASATARDLGLLVERAPTPGVHPEFVAGLVDLVQERHLAADAARPADPTGRPALSPLGPWYDVCRAGCCAPSRGEARPAVAGLG